jgi:ferritin-like protein
MPATIPGASVWEQELYDNLAAHVEGEREILGEYERLVEEGDDSFFTYLAQIILADEVRHHQLFNDLAATVKAFAEFRTDDERVPPIPHRVPNAPAIAEQTKRFLAIERQDLKELKSLSKRLSTVKDTTIWDLVVQLMTMDTEKHIRILEFIGEHVRP